LRMSSPDIFTHVVILYVVYPCMSIT